MSTPTSFVDSNYTPSLDDYLDLSSLSPSPEPLSPTSDLFIPDIEIKDTKKSSMDSLDLDLLFAPFAEEVKQDKYPEQGLTFNVASFALPPSPNSLPSSETSPIEGTVPLPAIPGLSMEDFNLLAAHIAAVAPANTVNPGDLLQLEPEVQPLPAPASEAPSPASTTISKADAPVKPVVSRKRSRDDSPIKEISDAEKLRLLPELCDAEDEGKKGQARSLFPQTEITAIHNHLGIAESKLKSLGSWRALYLHLQSTAKPKLPRLYDIIAALQARRKEGRASKKAKDAKLKSDAAAKAAAEHKAVQAEAQRGLLQAQVDTLQGKLSALEGLLWQKFSEGGLSDAQFKVLCANSSMGKA